MGDNRIEMLPDWFFKLNELKELYLYGNLLSNLPSKIKHLSNLTTLVLSNNNLTTIPSELTQLTNLRRLSLDSNAFTKLSLEEWNTLQLLLENKCHVSLAKIPFSFREFRKTWESTISRKEHQSLKTFLERISESLFPEEYSEVLIPLYKTDINLLTEQKRKKIPLTDLYPYELDERKKDIVTSHRVSLDICSIFAKGFYGLFLGLGISKLLTTDTGSGSSQTTINSPIVLLAILVLIILIRSFYFLSLRKEHQFLEIKHEFTRRNSELSTMPLERFTNKLRTEYLDQEINLLNKRYEFHIIFAVNAFFTVIAALFSHIATLPLTHPFSLDPLVAGIRNDLHDIWTLITLIILIGLEGFLVLTYLFQKSRTKRIKRENTQKILDLYKEKVK